MRGVVGQSPAVGEGPTRGLAMHRTALWGLPVGNICCFSRPASLRAQVWQMFGCGDPAVGEGNGSATLHETSWPRTWLDLPGSHFADPAETLPTWSCHKGSLGIS